MSSVKGVSIVNTSDDSNKYIIKDGNGIMAGRFNFIEMDTDNKNVLIKLKMYKKGHEAGVILQEALKLILDNLFKNRSFHKVNILCEEGTSLFPFQSIGFSLEGYMEDTIKVDADYIGSILFGITDHVYYGGFCKKDVLIKGRNIDIKVLTPDDAEEMLEYYKRNRRFLSSYEPHREESFFDVETQKQLLMDDYKEFINEEGVHFGIYADERLIGRIRISNIIYGVFKSGFIGYSIDEQQQGHGYMTEAVNLVLNYAYKELGLHRVEATTLLDNERSQSVLLRCGFNELGICKDYLRINGKWRDHKIFYKNN